MKHIIFALLMSVVSISGAQTIKPGKIAYDGENLYFSKPPVNTVSTYDSVDVIWRIYCKAGNALFDTAGVYDSVKVKLGMTVVHATTRWFRGGVPIKAQSPPLCTYNPGCFDLLIDDDDPVEYNAYWENGLITVEGQGPGTIIIYSLDPNSYYNIVRIIDFDIPGKYDPALPPGQYMTYVVFWDEYLEFYL